MNTRDIPKLINELTLEGLIRIDAGLEGDWSAGFKEVARRSETRPIMRYFIPECSKNKTKNTC